MTATLTVDDAYLLIERMLAEGWTYQSGDMNTSPPKARYNADMQAPGGEMSVRVYLDYFFLYQPDDAQRQLRKCLTAFSEHTTGAHLDLPPGNGREAALLAIIAEQQTVGTGER